MELTESLKTLFDNHSGDLEGVIAARVYGAHLPRLLDDIRAIVDGQSQTDPQFRNQRLYTRLSVEEVRRQLIAQKDYTSANCPKRETLRLRLNALGYHPQRVAKKRSPKPTPSSSG